MATLISNVLNDLFPDGTNGDKSLQDVPQWLPDLFAASAILLQKSGAYTHPAFFKMSRVVFDVDFEKWRDLGLRLAEAKPGEDPFPELQKRWQRILDRKDRAIVSDDTLRAETPPDWTIASFELMHLADLGCYRFGFSHGELSTKENSPRRIVYSAIQSFIISEHNKRLQRISELDTIEEDFTKQEQLLQTISEKIRVKEFQNPLPFSPASLCRHVPPDVACVQPRASTPQLGQTIRSYSHNLSLLPPQGEVRALWYNTNFNDLRTVTETKEKRSLNERETLKRRGLNLLVVPYPFRVSGSCFSPRKRDDVLEKNFFEIEQKWLQTLGDRVINQAYHIAQGVNHLIDQALDEVGSIDGVVFPELAMSHAVAEIASTQIFDHADKSKSRLRFFVCGVLSKRKVTMKKEGRPINSVFVRATTDWHFDDNESIRLDIRRLQTKHHRWRVDAPQIKHYNLSSFLAIDMPVIPDSGSKVQQTFPIWWEDTDVVERECLFWVLPHDNVLATVICEDLARIEPVQEVLRAVGPTLTIALLMDGEQENWRWANRYASVLSDDPGCSVMTLTSLGMIRRSRSYEPGSAVKIGYWKDDSGDHELKLPPKAAAICVSLSEDVIQEPTASDREQRKNEVTRKLVLAGTIPIVPLEKGKKLFIDL